MADWKRPQARRRSASPVGRPHTASIDVTKAQVYGDSPEDWRKAVAIVAHPDDMEFGAAAAVARWTRQGKEIVYVMVTSGEAGIDGLAPDECRRVREVEQVESARVVGVDEVEFLGFPDGVVEYGLPLRAAVADVVRRHRPEIVITGNFRDTFGPGALNQADHMAVGRAVLDGVRDAANRWIFPEQLVDGREKWGGVRAVWATGSPEARHGVDTTDTFDAGVASLAAVPANEAEAKTWEAKLPPDPNVKRILGVTPGFGQALARLGLQLQGLDPAYTLILINGEPVDALSLIVHRSKSYDRGRSLTAKLPAQQVNCKGDIHHQHPD